MNDQFDELAKGLAQSVTRRGALKKFGVGLAGAVLASLGLANRTHAGGGCKCHHWRCSGYAGVPPPQDFFICGNKKPPLAGVQGYFCQDFGLVDSSACKH